MFIVRKIQLSDLKRVRSMLFELNDMHYKALPADYKAPEELDKLIDLNQYICGENELGLVASFDDHIVGFEIDNIFERKGLLLSAIKTASGADIYVVESHRSDGVGKQLMAAFEKEVRLQGGQEVMVEIYSFN